MTYKFGDVILVPFPFTDQSSAKKRPAVIVSCDRYNRKHPDLVVMAITSQTQTALLSDHRVINDWQRAGLLKPSVLKPIIMTIEIKLVLRTMGQLQIGDRQILQTLLAEIFPAP
jgi:mRNA interferase MazF